jgi:hypothetical protein
MSQYVALLSAPLGNVPPFFIITVILGVLLDLYGPLFWQTVPVLLPVDVTYDIVCGD